MRLTLGAMKTRTRLFLAACVAALAALGHAHAYVPPDLPGSATPLTPPEERTLAPYFHVPGANDTHDAFPLKSTKVRAHLSGVIAEVEVTQTYQNTGAEPLEAIYVFPASTRAAVHAMTMKIGERLIRAEVQERERAKATYDAAKAEGKSASLLEQQRPNVFQTSVANILPGDTVEVQLSYTELLTATERVYEWVFPTVVGPRYSNAREGTPQADGQRWVENPFLAEGTKNPVTFELSAELDAGLPLQSLSCPSHAVKTEYKSESHASLALDQTDPHGGNRDFVLRYVLAGQQVNSGLLLHRATGGKGENFFLVNVQPPKRITADAIMPRDYVFVVDVSGSMQGFPIETAKELLRDLISGLKQHETFNVVLFAGSARVLARSALTATRGHIDDAIDFITKELGGGGTELQPALEAALKLPRPESSSRSFVVVTDGLIAAEKECFDTIREHLDEANVFTFGIGSSVNRYLIEGLARIGRGEPFVVLDGAAAPKMAARFRQYVSAPVFTGVKVKFDGFDAYDVEPASVPDVFADRPVTIFGKWRGEPRGTIRVSGQAGRKDEAFSLPVNEAKTTNPALPYLWARERLALLSDYARLRDGGELRRGITELGLKFNLLTEYTSFVAVDQAVRNPEGKLLSVKQPLPLPQGVTNSAVGGAMKSTPEPGAAGLAIVALFVLLCARWRRVATA